MSRYFGPILTFLPCHTLTHLGTPIKYFVPTYICLSSQRFLSRGFLFGRFFPWWLLSVPLLSEYIHYNRKLNITFNFRFRMYEQIFKSVASYDLGPLSQTATPRTLPS